MEKIDIKQEAYFPFTFKFFGLILLAFGLLIWTQRDWFFLVKSLITFSSFGLGAAILTARYGLFIDPVEKTFREYVQVLFWKTGTTRTYQYIEKIFINEVTESATFQTRTGSTHDVKSNIHKAFLKLDNDEKIQLDKDKDRARLEQRIQNYRESLGVPE